MMSSIIILLLVTPAAMAAVIQVDPWTIMRYEDATAFVGDQVVFTWTGTHNVYIHPSGSCDETGAIVVSGVSPATYNFVEADAGTDVYFACDIGQHCEAGQIIKFSVSSLPIDPPATEPPATGPPATEPPAGPGGNTIEVNPWTVQPYQDMMANVGDTVLFTWTSVHNVYIHPSGSCDETGAIDVGETSPASYTFTAAEEGTDVYFACDIGQHCESGQIVKFTVMAATDPPATAQPSPATDAPATDAPATDPPATTPPDIDPPATEAPATDPPATSPPSPNPPEEQKCSDRVIDGTAYEPRCYCSGVIVDGSVDPQGCDVTQRITHTAPETGTECEAFCLGLCGEGAGSSFACVPTSSELMPCDGTSLCQCNCPNSGLPPQTIQFPGQCGAFCGSANACDNNGAGFSYSCNTSSGFTAVIYHAVAAVFGSSLIGWFLM